MRIHGHRTAKVAALLAAAAALLLPAMAGCGGGDETTPATGATTELPTGTLSKEELVQTADGLCADATERILADASPPDFGGDGPQPDEVAASAGFWRATAGEGQTLVDQLSQLQPPKDEQEQWNEFLDLMEAGTVDYANALVGPAENGDPDSFYQAAVDSQRELIKLAKASKALGLKVCGARELGS